MSGQILATSYSLTAIPNHFHLKFNNQENQNQIQETTSLKNLINTK